LPIFVTIDEIEIILKSGHLLKTDFPRSTDPVLKSVSSSIRTAFDSPKSAISPVICGQGKVRRHLTNEKAFSPIYRRWKFDSNAIKEIMP
jgi:hypothetical protein